MMIFSTDTHWVTDTHWAPRARGEERQLRKRVGTSPGGESSVADL